MLNRIGFLSILMLLFISKSWGQCGFSASISVPDTVCGAVNITNNSSLNMSSYDWDFCLGDIENTASKALFATFPSPNTPSNITIYYDSLNSKWVGMAISSNFPATATHIDLGANFTSPTLTSMLSSGNIVGTSKIDVIYYKGAYHGYTIGKSTKQLYYFNFGNSLNPVTPTVLGTISALSAPGDLSLKIHNDSLYILFTNTTTLSTGVSVYKFTNPSTVPILQTHWIVGLQNRIAKYEDCDHSYFFTNPTIGNYILKFSLGANFPFSTTFDTIPTNAYPKAFQPIREGNKKYLFYSTGTAWDRINLDVNWSSINIISSVATFTNNPGFYLVKNQGQWMGLALDASNRSVQKITFPQTCSGSNTFFTGYAPPILTGFNLGKLFLEYKMTTPNGLTKYVLDSVVIRPSPQIDFTFNKGCFGQPTHFSPNITISGDVIQSVFWDFGNGQTFLGMNPPDVTYLTTGSYPVKVIVTAAQGCIDSLTKTVVIPITPIANFNFTIGCQGSATNFTNISTFDPLDTISSYNWTFGSQNSTSANPTIIFNTAGPQTITLQMTTSHGCTDDTTLVINIPEKPTALFNYQNSCLSQSTQFINNSTGIGNTYLWDFGDGNTSPSNNPTHTYAGLGTFTVKLIATAGNGCQDSITQNISIANPVTPTFTVSSPVCQASPITFTNTSGVAEYFWNFGTGNVADTSNQTSPVFSFPNAGNYYVKLRTKSGSGCFQTDSVLVTVSPGPVVNFQADSICEGSSYSFTDNTFVPGGQSVTQAIWNYGDGNSDTIMNPTYPYTQVHQYSGSGNFTITVTANSNTGCTNTLIKNARIYAKPVASAIVTNTVVGGNWQIVNNSSADTTISTWTWNVSGLGVFNGQNPIITASNPGTFNVDLMIETVTGCKDTFNTTVQVLGSSMILPDTACGDVLVQNNSAGIFAQTQWDFCVGDLQNTPNTNNLGFITTVYFPSNFSCYYDTLQNKWLGFVNHSTSSGMVSLADFGSNITNTPTYTTMLTSPNIIGTSKLQIVKINGNYHGYIIGKTSKQLYYFNFGANLSAVTPVSLGTIPALNTPSDIALFVENDTLYAAIANSAGVVDGLMIYKFTTLNALPTFQTSIGYSNLDRLFYYQDANSKFLLSSPATGNYLLKTTNLLSTPQTDTIFVPTKPISMFATREGNQRFIFYGHALGIDRIKVNSAWQAQQTNTINSAVTNANGCWLVKNSSKWYAFSLLPASKRLYRLDFPDTCVANPLTSNNQNPGNISYQSTGLQHIELVSTDTSGLHYFAEDSVYVNPKPSVDFLFSGACFNNPVTFTPNITIAQDVVQSVFWDFGNGTTSTQLNPNPITYSSGTYHVKLIVKGAKGCQDSISKSVYIPIQLQANFNANISCQANSSIFTHTSIFDPGDSIVSYSWVFGTEGTSNLANPIFTFANSGNVIVKLIIQTKNGCVDSVSQTLNIPEKPIALWNVSQTCLGSNTVFTNSSTNGNQYFWDFGDGNNSVQMSPNHVFADTGTYQVKLIVTSLNGCKDSLSQAITITNVPNVSFNAPAQICQGSSATFTDNSTVLGAQITNWFWNFGTGNIADTSIVQNPTFIFPQSGNFWVKLTVKSGTSCFVTDSIQVSVTPAATPGFSVNPTCIGQSTFFIDTTLVPLGVTVQQAIWIYGDGNSDTINNPVYPYTQIHTYATAGTYAVQLQTLSSSGCQGIFNGYTSVHQYPSANASIPQGISGENIQLTDLSTSSDTTLVSWNWNIAGIGNFTDQNPIFTAVTGNFPVELIVTNAAGCQDTFSSSLTVSGAYFTVQDTICMENELSINNLSSPMSGQNWDMCMGDLDLAQTKVNLGNLNSSLSNPYSLTSYFDTLSGKWFAFIGSSSLNSRMIRMNLGNNLTPTVIDTLINNTNIIGTSSLDIIYFKGNYHGYLVGRNSRQLFHFDFGNSIANTPTVTSLGAFAASIVTPNDVKVVNRNDSLYALVANNGVNGVAIFRFDSPNVMPSSIYNWSNIGAINKINFFKDNHSMVFTIPANGNMILKHTFNGNFPYNPTTDTISIISPARCIFATREGNRRYIFWTTPTALNRMKMDNSWNMIQTDSIQSFTNVMGGWLVKDSSRWHALTIEFTDRTLQRLDFDDPCSATPLLSDSLNPMVSYHTPGTKAIELKAFDALGNQFYYEDSLFVVPSATANFSYSSACEGNISFTNLTTYIDSTTAISYTWDFGDGSPLDFSTNPIHNFIAGTYQITLSAAVPNGCVSTKVINLTINPMPQSVFTFSTSCANNPTQFTNQSSIANPGNITFYKWDFGDGSTSFDTNPTHQYLIGGTYTVSLVAISDLGCADTSMQTIVIPKVNFTFENTCFGEAVQFTSDVIYPNDVITGYQWDFGDGNFDTNANPLHVYTQLKNYTVKLTVSTTNGCADTIVKVIEITQRPSAAYTTSGNFCVGAPIAFLDASIITTRPIATWKWNFNDPAAGVDSTSNLKNPIHTFTTAGSYTVTLDITTTTGCHSTYQQTYTVGEAPHANFSIPDTLCTLTNIQVSDSSTTSSGNLTWLWNLPNGSYSTLQNPQVNFGQSGNYIIKLTVTSDLGCTDSKSDTILVNPSPIPNFTANIPQTPSNITFTNTSILADSFAWFVNGNYETSNTNLTYNFQSAGDYTVTLLALTDSGCAVAKTIQFTLQTPITPIWDIAVEQVRYINTNNRLKVFADVRNKGNLPVTKFEMYLKLGFEQQNYELHFDTLMPGMMKTIPLTAEVFVNPYETEPFICVKADKPNDSTDIYLADNEQCTAVISDFILLPITPNPVQSQMSLGYIIPTSDFVRVWIIDVNGKKLTTIFEGIAPAGLNRLVYDVSVLSKAEYFVRVEYQSKFQIKKFVKW